MYITLYYIRKRQKYNARRILINPNYDVNQENFL